VTLLVCTLKEHRAKAVFTVNIMEAHRTYKGDSDHPYVGRTGLGEVETVGSAVLNNILCNSTQKLTLPTNPISLPLFLWQQKFLGLINLPAVWGPRNSQSRIQPAWLHLEKDTVFWVLLSFRYFIISAKRER